MSDALTAEELARWTTTANGKEEYDWLNEDAQRLLATIAARDAAIRERDEAIRVLGEAYVWKRTWPGSDHPDAIREANRRSEETWKAMNANPLARSAVGGGG